MRGTKAFPVCSREYLDEAGGTVEGFLGAVHRDGLTPDFRNERRFPAPSSVLSHVRR
jgi:hypothetical protein